VPSEVTLTIGVLSDLHGETALLRRPTADLAGCDLLVLCGDLTHFGGEREAQTLLDLAQRMTPHLLAVGGNCDHLSVHHLLEQRGIGLHATCRRVLGMSFCGLAGARPGPHHTPFTLTEAQQAVALERGIALAKPSEPLVLVSHEPPLRTRADRLSGGEQVGSPTVRQAIERHQPILCLCGHIHESPDSDMLANTLVVNPGPARDGRYALVRLSSKGQVIDHRLRHCP